MTATYGRWYGGRKPQRWPASADAVARWCGRTPSHGWLFQDASTPAVAAFGGENLAEVNTVDTWADATPYPNKLALTFTDADNGRVEASDNTKFDDDGATSHAWLFYCKFGVITGATRGIFGKSDGVNYYAGRTVVTSGSVYVLIRDGTTLKTAIVTVDHSSIGTWVWMAIDRTNALLNCATRLGSASTDITGIGTLANLSTWNIGAPATFSPNMSMYAMYRFSGANAEGELGPTILNKVARYLG